MAKAFWRKSELALVEMFEKIIAETTPEIIGKTTTFHFTNLFLECKIKENIPIGMKNIKFIPWAIS